MILYITIRSDWGGGPKHLDLLIENLKHRYPLFVAAPLNEPYGIKWKSELGESNFFKLPFRKFSFVKLLALKRFMMNNNIKIVHAHGKGAGLYARLLKILLPEIKIILTWHGFHIGAYGLIKRILYIFYERFFERYTDMYINVSGGEKKVCLAHNIYPESKSRVIYNAVPLTEVDYDKKLLREKLKLPQDKKIILSVTRFDFAKNMQLAVSIAEMFKNENDYLFIWVGDGEDKPKIEKEIKMIDLNNVHLTGFRDNPLDYIAASDVYLSTSRWEGMPYSLIESAMLGLPAVATNVTGNNEVVFNNENGFLFNPDDPQSAAGYIRKICTNPELFKKFAEKSKKIFFEKFSLNVMITEIEMVYQKVIGKSK
jgi:glycosyltransferase involved in cell wall biosynthesis